MWYKSTKVQIYKQNLFKFRQLKVIKWGVDPCLEADQDQATPSPFSNSILENFRAKLDWRKETLNGWEDLLHLELLISTTIIVTVIQYCHLQFLISLIILTWISIIIGRWRWSLLVNYELLFVHHQRTGSRPPYHNNHQTPPNPSSTPTIVLWNFWNKKAHPSSTPTIAAWNFWNQHFHLKWGPGFNFYIIRGIIFEKVRKKIKLEVDRPMSGFSDHLVE